MKRILIAIGVIAAAIGVGCEPAEKPAEEADESASDRGERVVEIAGPDASSPKPTVPPVVEFEIWPGGGDWSVADLMWLGADEPLALREEPSRSAPISGQGQWDDGQMLEWTTSLVRVLKPRPYRVTEEITLVGTPYDREARELEARDEEYELAVDERLWLYQYDTDQMCYLYVADQVVLTDCPGEAMVAEDERGLADGPAYQPLKQQWWVEVTSGDEQGWFEVWRAPIEVHSREADGFDEFEGGPDSDGPGPWPERGGYPEY